MGEVVHCGTQPSVIQWILHTTSN